MIRILSFLYLLMSCQIVFGQGKISRENKPNSVQPHSKQVIQNKHPRHLSLAAVNSKGVREYFTIDEWKSISKLEQDKFKKIGICILVNGYSFIIAGNDAGKAEFSWRNYQDGIVPGLRCFSTKEAAIQDFDGKDNSKKLTAINSPAAVAACMYKAFQGDNTDWYLPACGQLWIISQNAFAINKALNNFGFEKFHLPPAYNSSTQMGVENYFDRSYSWGWGVNLSSAGVYKYGGCNNDYVRSVADL